MEWEAYHLEAAADLGRTSMAAALPALRQALQGHVEALWRAPQPNAVVLEQLGWLLALAAATLADESDTEEPPLLPVVRSSSIACVICMGMLATVWPQQGGPCTRVMG